MLRPGFRFHPTDVELVKYYLKRKVVRKNYECDVIAEVDIYKNEPWDLPDKSYLPSRDLKWYFFSPREKKYCSGGRLNRATEQGYWKTTGKDRHVLQKAVTVGMIKTLVYHQGRAPKGERTDWVMHEYRWYEKDLADRGVVQDTFVLCVVFRKEGPGPRNGAEYGAPFEEDDWSDNEFDYTGKELSEYQPIHSEVTGKDLSEHQPAHSEVTTAPVSASLCTVSASDLGRSDVLPSAENLLPVAEIDGFSALDLSQIQEDDDLFSLSDFLQEDHGPDSTENNEKELNNSIQATDGNDIFEGLGDLHSWFGLSENRTTTADPAEYIQLTDLETPLN